MLAPVLTLALAAGAAMAADAAPAPQPATLPTAPGEAPAPAAAPPAPADGPAAPPATDAAARACALALGVLDAGELTAETASTLRSLGVDAAEPVAEVLALAGNTAATAALLEAMALVGNPRQGASVRPHVFATDEELAVAATYALLEIDGPRAVPTLEHLARTSSSFGQSLFAVEALHGLGLPSSFLPLARIAEDEARHPVLRAEAARALPGLDEPQTRKWIKRLRLPAGTSPFVVAELTRIFTALWPQERSPEKSLFR